MCLSMKGSKQFSEGWNKFVYAVPSIYFVIVPGGEKTFVLKGENFCFRVKGLWSKAE